MLLLRLGFFGRLVSYLFSFNHVFYFKVFGIFVLVCDKISNKHKAWERQAVKKPPFLIIPQITHTPKRHYSHPTASYFLGRKLSLLFNKVFKKAKIVRYTDQTSFCLVG